MMEFFKFGSKRITEAGASKHLPNGPKGNACEARKGNVHHVTRGFGEFLVEEGSIKEYQLEEALAVRNKSGEFLGQILVDLGHLDRDTMFSVLENQYGIPHMQLMDRTLDRDVADLIPQDICRSYSLIAVGKDGRDLTVAMADPLDKTVLVKVRRACRHYDIKPVLCDRRLIENLQSMLFEDPSAGGESVNATLGRKQTPGMAAWTRLGELLITHGVISQQQCDEALAYQVKHGGFFGQCLVDLGVLSQDRLTCFLVKQLGIPYLNLVGYEMERDVLALVPKDICLDHCLLPIDTLGRTLTIAMVNPLDTEAIEEIGKLHPGLRVKPILCTWEDFKIVVAKEFFRHEEDFDASILDGRLQKPKEAVLSEDVLRDAIRNAVSDAVTGLFKETAARHEDPASRPTRRSEAKTAFDPFVPKSGRPSCLRVDEYQVSKEALATIPRDVCLAYRLLPLEKVGRILAVAMVDTQILDQVRRLCPGLRIRPVPCNDLQFRAAAARAFHE